MALDTERSPARWTPRAPATHSAGAPTRIFATPTLNLHAPPPGTSSPPASSSAGAQVNILPSAAVAITGDGSYLDDSDGSAVAINNQGTVTFSVHRGR